MVYSLILLVHNQCVGDVLKGPGDGLLVADQKLFPLRLSDFIISGPATRIENRHVNRAGHGVRAAATDEQAHQVCRLKPASGREIDAGVESCFCHANARICGNQVLLGRP